MIEGLDEICAIDGKPLGDHTMAEWYGHLERQEGTHHAFEQEPDGGVTLKLGDDDDLAVADHVDAIATLFQGETNEGIRISVPLVVLDFQVGHGDGTTTRAARLGFVGTPELLRATGKLLRDACYGAANAAEPTDQPSSTKRRRGRPS